MRHLQRHGCVTVVAALLLLFPVTYAALPQVPASEDAQPAPAADGWDDAFWGQWQSENTQERADASYEEKTADYEELQAQRDIIFQSILNGEYIKGKLRDIPKIVMSSPQAIPLIKNVSWEPVNQTQTAPKQETALRSILSGAFLLFAGGIAGYLLLHRPEDSGNAQKKGQNPRIE